MSKYQNSIDSRLLSMMSMVECVTLPLFLFINTLLENKRSVEYIMGEVMICRGGSGSGAGGKGNKKLISVAYTESGTFIVPEAINNEFSVRIFGGGGAGFCNYYNTSRWAMSGGGSGWMNNDVIILTSGDCIPVTIGAGGISSLNNNGNSGGTTSFGTFLSASGGAGGRGSYFSGYGGSGGAGGAGLNGGGDGYQFGGGGGFYSFAGNGGVWGGGGGCSYRSGNGGIYGGGGKANSYVSGGKGGTYGGNGGKNGTNTIGWTNTEVFIANGSYLTGSGICKKPGNYCYGGGGFGGNGGNNDFGGGGGYVGNGGDDCGGGGGFGFGADGGWRGGGGGYYSKGGNGLGGGGGSYGPGGTGYMKGSYGGGGGGEPGTTSLVTDGGDGICIIQYYTYQ